MKTDSTTLEQKIAEIKAQHEAQALKEIEQYKLSFEVDGARKELEAKHKAELKELAVEQAKQSKELASSQTIDATNFERKYGVPFTIKPATPKKEQYSTNAKAEIIFNLKDKDGKPKFTYKDGNVFGQKSQTEPLKNIIPFKDKDGNKQSLNLSTYIEWCKDNLKTNIKPDLGGNLGNI